MRERWQKSRLPQVAQPLPQPRFWDWLVLSTIKTGSPTHKAASRMYTMIKANHLKPVYHSQAPKGIKKPAP